MKKPTRKLAACLVTWVEPNDPKEPQYLKRWFDNGEDDARAFMAELENTVAEDIELIGMTEDGERVVVASTAK